jgi:hypothetical protein
MKGPQTNDRCSPLPRRSGHGDFPHPALASVVSSRRHSQTHQSQMFQVRVEAAPLAGAPAPWTASLQMLPQPTPPAVVQVPKHAPRITPTQIFGPAPPMAVQPPDQLRQRRVALLRINQPSQRLPLPRPRLARRPPVPVGLGEVHPPHGLRTAALLPQAALPLVQKRGFAFGRRPDRFEAHLVHSRCPAVAPHRRPRGPQRVAPAHQAVPTVEAVALLS